MKKYIFRPITDSVITKFTHYWTNDGENYPDVKDIEKDYLEVNYPDYGWVEVPDLRLEQNKLDIFKIEMSVDEMTDNKTVFIKIEDETGQEINRYYYATSITQLSDENYNYQEAGRQAYSVICELDCWATFGCKMNDLMKQDECKEVFLFSRKMCNRFHYNDDYTAYTFNYLTEPWLMHPVVGATELIKHPEEESIDLLDWQFINQTEADSLDSWNNIFNKWLSDNMPTSYIDLSEVNQKKDSTLKPTLDNKHYQNMSLCNNKIFNDSSFNSKGKYRYFTFKIGNNTLPIDDTAAANKYKAGIKTESVEISKNIEGSKPEESKTYINGEDIMMIPIPKGEEENRYIWYLNSTNKGLVIGNGSVLGMPVNDIPPSVLALALRKYNNNINEQTIGDKLSFRSLIQNNLTTFKCPLDLVSLKMFTIWDWPVTVFENSQSDDSKWCEYHHGVRLGVWWSDGKPKSTITQGMYCWAFEQYTTTTSTETSESKWLPVIDPSTGESWQMNQLWGESASERNGTCCWLQFVGGTPGYEKNGYVKKNWKVLCILDESESASNAIIHLSKIPPESKEDLKKLSKGRWYWTGDKAASSYLNVYNYLVEQLDYIPTIIHDFSNIPITITRNDSANNLYCGTMYFEEFKRILTLGDKPNIKENEPLLYSPSYWQWIYYIDGLHKIVLTGDMLDFTKLMKPDWDIYLNTSMNVSTFLRLDINSIKNDSYPFTKGLSQLIAADNVSFPRTCEAYNNWLEGNSLTQETSKNAKDIDIKWAKTNWGLQQHGNFIGNIGAGASIGSIGGGIGVAAGAAGGAAMGLIGLFTSRVGLNNRIKEINEQWENKWRGDLGNMYNAPTSLNPSGFASGSLMYLPNDEASTNYSLFKTFTLTENAKTEVWDNVSMYGYFYKSQDLYKSYDNRKNFNIVNCSFDTKSFYVDNYLRDKMMQKSMIFSQQMFIDWFKMKCKSLMRLFKVDFIREDLDNIIKGNIEISYMRDDVLYVYGGSENLLGINKTAGSDENTWKAIYNRQSLPVSLRNAPQGVSINNGKISWDDTIIQGEYEFEVYVVEPTTGKETSKKIYMYVIPTEFTLTADIPSRVDVRTKLIIGRAQVINDVKINNISIMEYIGKSNWDFIATFVSGDGDFTFEKDLDGKIKIKQNSVFFRNHAVYKIDININVYGLTASGSLTLNIN